MPNQPNFNISDITEQTKNYCLLTFGYYDLAEMFYPEFMQWWREILEDGRKPKWKHPDLALKRWVRLSSPKAKGFTTVKWESAINKCKAKLNAEKPQVPIPVIKTTPKPVDPEIARQAMRQMIRGLG